MKNLYSLILRKLEILKAYRRIIKSLRVIFLKFDFFMRNFLSFLMFNRRLYRWRLVNHNDGCFFRYHRYTFISRYLRRCLPVRSRTSDVWITDSQTPTCPLPLATWYETYTYSEHETQAMAICQGTTNSRAKNIITLLFLNKRNVNAPKIYEHFYFLM